MQPPTMEVADQFQARNTPMFSAMKTLYVSVFIWGFLGGAGGVTTATKHGGPQETNLNVGISSLVSPATCQFAHLWPSEYPARHIFAVNKDCGRLTHCIEANKSLRLLTYELMQEDERGDVTGQAQELAHDHEPMPRLNGQSHHQQLRQDQRGEGDGNDVHELRLEKQQRSVHDDASCGGQQQHIDWGHMTSQTSQIKFPGTCTRGWVLSKTAEMHIFDSFLAENTSW